MKSYFKAALSLVCGWSKCNPPNRPVMNQATCFILV